MKLLKKTILLSLVAPLLFSLLSFTNVVSDKEVLILRVYECSLGCEPRIIISDGEKSTQIALEKDKASTLVNKNTDTISKTLNQYYKEGYKIESSNSVIMPGGQMITSYILAK